MCIAIVNKSEFLAESVFENSFENNPDGCGMAYVMDGKVRIIHNLHSWKSLYDEYALIRPKTKYPIMIHFRIGTSGIKDERNIHPFMINSDMALIHNGMISYNSIYEDKSDTWHFVEFLKSLKSPKNLLNPDSIEFNSISALTSGSKLCILHNSGRFSILNESAGTWDGDSWYSNNTYKYGLYNPKDWNSGWNYNYDDDLDTIGFVFDDLKEWHKNVILDSDVYDLCISLKSFKKLTYAQKSMYVLSIGNSIYDMDYKVTAYKAVSALQALNGVKNMEELFPLLVDNYELMFAGYSEDEYSFESI